MRKISSVFVFLVAAAGLTGCQDPTPAIQASTDLLAIGTSTQQFPLEVWNFNPEVDNLTIAIRPTVNWIVVSEPDVVSNAPASATGPFDIKIIQVSIDRSQLQVGQHEGFIELSGEDVETVEVRVTVNQLTPPVPGGLQVANVQAQYAAPFVVGFDFSVRNQTGEPVVADPGQIQIVAQEGSTNVESPHLRRGAARQIRAFLVLDYSENVSGIPGATQQMEQAAKDIFLPSLNADAQVGIYYFHVEPAIDPATGQPFPDTLPQKVADFTVDRLFLRNAIDSIAPSIGGFFGFSVMWDAMAAAAREFEAAPSASEDRYIILFSNGRDDSSTNTLNSVLALARDRRIRIYTIGIGENADATNLQTIASATDGRFFPAASVGALQQAFQQIVNELEGQYSVRWASPQPGSAAPFQPRFTVTVNGLSASYTEPTAFVPAQYQGNRLVGRLSIQSSDNGTRTTAFLRANYVPRAIDKFRIYLESDYSFSVTNVDTVDEGLFAGWTFAQEQDPVLGGTWVRVDSPSGAIPFATFGPMLRIQFDEVLPPEVAAKPFTQVYVDPSLYQNGQSFEVEGYANTPPV